MGDETMSKVCHRHCPDESGALLAALTVAVLTAVLAVIAAQVIESLFVAIVITGSVLIAAGTGLFAYLVHRDRAHSPVNAPRAMPATAWLPRGPLRPSQRRNSGPSRPPQARGFPASPTPPPGTR